MRDNLVSAVFDNQTDAERAVSQLRQAGVQDSSISVIAQRGEGDSAVTTDGNGEEVAKDVIGTAALGVGSKDLLADLNAAGFHFEALVVRDLRIYAQPLGGTISTWRESHGRKEVDAIVETPSGWAAFEVKLTGDQSVIDAAASGLTQFASEIDQDRHGAPSALVVVTAVGGGGKRADGVHVVPITAFGP